MKQSDFFLENKSKIIELLNDGCNVAGVIDGLREFFPEEPNLFGEDSIVEIPLDNFNLSKFINSHQDCKTAMIKGEYKRELKTKAKRQEAMAKILETKDHITPETILAEKRLLRKHRNVIEKSMLDTGLLETAMEDGSIGADGQEFTIDLSQDNDISIKRDVLEDIIPVSTIGTIREIIKRFGPLGYTSRQMADLAGTSPEIFEEVIKEVPELEHAVKIAKHLLFENIGNQFFKAISPGTIIKKKFTVARDVKNPEIAIGKLENFTTEGYRGNPDALFKIFKAMGKDLKLPMFNDDDSIGNAQTGVLEISPEKSTSEWEDEAKQYQKDLVKREQEEL